MNSKTLKAAIILIGTTIGAGIFGIPYAIAQIGFAPGICYLLALGTMILLLNLIYGEVILRTPGDHQLTGYGEIYFGKSGKFLATLALLFGLYGGLWAYLLKIGEFTALISGLDSPLLFSLVFFIFAAAAIFRGLKTIAQAELILVGLMLLFIVILAVVGLPHLQFANYELQITNYKFIFLPYGVILFALTGYSAIPEMEEILRRPAGRKDSRRQLKKAILAGTAIPVLVYLFFAALVVGLTGDQTGEDAISSLSLSLPGWVAQLGGGLGILTMSTSFLALGYVLREVWFRDFHFSKPKAVFLALTPPLLLFLFGPKSFFLILELTGALTGGLAGILIIGLFFKARKLGQKTPAYCLYLPRWLIILLGIILLGGMLTPFL